jgi:RNA polymerase sigma factor (sigma-70 family)
MAMTFDPRKPPSEKDFLTNLQLFNEGHTDGLFFMTWYKGPQLDSFIENKFPGFPDKDILIETSFTKTFESRKKNPPFETVNDLVYYASRVAYHECIDHFRRLKKEKRIDVDPEEILFSEDADEDFDMHLYQHIAIEVLHQLPDGKLKSIGKDTYIEGLSTEELALKYNMERNKVRAYQSRVVKRIKASRPIKELLFFFRKKNLGH